ncbi:MAG: adenylate/guanylate cyclase domain-containing protein [Cyanobacteria bacterium]|nr:adenylate/guanylate cyclase domain-containing protein [Cyanobacteriota bacterium]
MPEALDYVGWRRQFLLKRLRLVLSLAVVAYLSFIVLQSVLISHNLSTLAPSWLVMAVIVEICLLGCLGLTYTKVGQKTPAFIFLASAWSVTLIEQLWATLNGFALFGLFAWTLVFLTLAAIVPVCWQLHLTAQLGTLAYYSIAVIVLRLPNHGQTLDISYALYLFWFCAICDLGVYRYERLQHAEFEARRWLRIEQEKSERLLLNVLPETIAHQLKHQDNPSIAEHYAEVSVLFADIVGFTALSTTMSPVDVVQLLNHLFSAFDQLADQHGLEKIKTIGDAYMVVGGLPIERADHAEAIADMALDMQRTLVQFNARYNYNLSIRIGIHTGPVIAGVIGTRKFMYDLWGDTVNTASRMESYGVPDRIQVTEAVYHRLSYAYRFQERGELDVKGKGIMKTYFLLDKRQPQLVQKDSQSGQWAEASQP